jgi:hypothetical protein
MSPGLFVEKLAKILGVPSKSIVVIDRALLEAGLRVRGGRGRSAASVTIADAATLLLTVMATPVLIRADQVILPWFRVKSWSLPRSAPEPFASMFSGGSPLPLLEFMEQLIGTPPEKYGDLTLVLEVSADQHAAMLYVRKGGRRCFEVGFLKYVDQETGADKARPAPPAPGDMTRHAKVTDATFHKLHRLFQPSTDPDALAMVKLGRRT